MKRAFLPFALLATAVVAHAQQQESGMAERIDMSTKKAIMATDAKAKYDPSLTSPLQSKTYGGAAFATKKYGTGAFEGTKSANLKTFQTHSFLGIKNPWFGSRIFKTDTSVYTSREATEASKDFRTDSYSVNEYAKAGKKDALDANAILPSSAEPRKYLGSEPKKSVSMDRFTQNLQKDLSIDDVRDLLNKGKGE
ncbi:MAG: hypothetical protein ACREKL_08880 [Chthoniobacterales bacterium]